MLELILDNIRVIHLNAKLTQYLKKLAIESNTMKQEKPAVEAQPEQVEQLQSKVSILQMTTGRSAPLRKS